MRIVISPSAGWTPDTIDLLRRRLDFAFGRFAGRVRSLTVRLKDLNGPRGGIDKACQIAIHLDWPRRTIVVEDVDAEPEAAIGRATQRASRAVARAVDASSGWRAWSPQT